LRLERGSQTATVERPLVQRGGASHFIESNSKVTGKPFAFVQVPLELLLAGLKAAGLPPVIIDAVASIEDMWAKGPSTLRRATSRVSRDGAPRRLIDVAKEYLA